MKQMRQDGARSEPWLKTKRNEREMGRDIMVQSFHKVESCIVDLMY